MSNKILGLILILIAGWLLWDNPVQTFKPLRKFFHPHAENFGEQVTEDLESLNEKHELPPEWKDIQIVNYLFNSDDQKTIMNHQDIEIPRNKKGAHKLEVELIDVPDDKDPALILQFSLFDVKTKNKIWELGRTYPLKQIIGLKSLPATTAAPAK